MNYYYVETPYYCHDLKLGESSLVGPFKSKKARIADIENKRSDEVDEWNLQEDGISLLLIQSTTPITGSEAMMPVAPCFEEDVDVGIGVNW